MIWTILRFAGYFIIVLALLAYASFLASRYFRLDRYPDEMHFVSTTDHWRIAVWRYRPAQPLGADPVVLLHGLGANATNLDLTDQLSLARYLAAAGYDTWLVEFRGRGHSTRPELFSKFRYDWCFDEYVDRDIPAALGEITRATGRSRMHFVGFSVGGLALYAHLSDLRRTEEVVSAVTIAAPSSFKRQSRYVGGRLLRNLRWMRHRSMIRMMAPVSGYFGVGPSRLVRLRENLPGPIHRRAMVNTVSNFSRDEMLQYSDWIIEDVFRSIDHRRDYRKDMERIDTPMLFIAGGKDMLAPPDAVKAAFDTVKSVDKKFIIASRGQGMTSNYGHEDLVMGTPAPTDVFPLVRDWIDAHAGVAITRPKNGASEAAAPAAPVPAPPAAS